MVRRALCRCGGVIPPTGPGSMLELCPRCLRVWRNRQLVKSNAHYRQNHGYPDGAEVGASYVVNPIGMVVWKRRGAGGVRRAKNPRYYED